MGGLTNKYLEDLTHRFVKNNFVGVFPSDASPKIKKKNFSIIYNLSKHFEAGSHFIAIMKVGKKMIYFDSLGDKCSNHDINSFMKQFNIPIIFNKRKIQHNFSNFCGYYCFYFIYYCFFLENSLPNFLKLFYKNDLKQNDSLLLSFILKSINKH